MEFVLLWLFLSFVAGAIASSKGRSALVFFRAALVAGRNVERIERAQVNEGLMRFCAQCAELVRVEAIKCKHCGSEPVSVADERAAEEKANPRQNIAASYGFGQWLGSLFRPRAKRKSTPSDL